MNVTRAQELWDAWRWAADAATVAWAVGDDDTAEAATVEEADAFDELVEYVDAEGLQGTGFDPRGFGNHGENWSTP